MAEPAMRVALLARPGAACDNLQAALRQAGADVVLVADPTSGDPAAVSASSPQAVLVALEPGIEDALERYSGILLDPATTVIYDEVALAARRAGWDAARWARHLAAKLGSHHDVLPPGGETEADAEPAMRTMPAVQAEEPDPELHLGSEIDFGGFSDEMKMMLALDGEAGLDGEIAPDEEIAPDFAPAQASPPAPVPAPPQATPPAGGLADGIEWESLAVSAAPVPAPVASAPVEKPAPSAAPTSTPSFANLTLEEISPEPRAPAPASPAVAIADPVPPVADHAVAAARSTGGVIVLAGIGGPDAVRQFLSALPMGFPRAVVVRQRLDGGRHDRLVRQMQRATALPVELAQAGARLAPGHVYILPDAMTTASDTGAAFVGTDGPVPVLAGLAAADSAVLMLSGSDPASVAEVLAAGDAGAFVAAQALEECFDSEAPAALAAAGAAAAPPADLASRVAARWPNP